MLLNHHVVLTMWWNQIRLPLDHPLYFPSYLYLQSGCVNMQAHSRGKYNPRVKGFLYWMLGVAQTGSKPLQGILLVLLQELHS